MVSNVRAEIQDPPAICPGKKAALKRIRIRLFLHPYVGFMYIDLSIYLGFPAGSDGKRICLLMQKMLKPWVLSLGREYPLEKGIPTLVFLPGEFHGQRIWQAIRRYKG